jgi:hypothetical protein
MRGVWGVGGVGGGWGMQTSGERLFRGKQNTTRATSLVGEKKQLQLSAYGGCEAWEGQTL